MGLNINQKANLHNRFKFVLSDSRTGKVKQEAYAYNIILNSGLSSPVYQLGGNKTSYRDYFIRSDGDRNLEGSLGGVIYIGTGTGTLDPTRNTLFNEVGKVKTNFYSRDKNIEELTASYTQVGVFDETMAQNLSITEVGLGNNVYGSEIKTHALIEDSEGNPTTIEKGEWDILTVYSTVFLTLSHPYDTKNFLFIEGTNENFGNGLLDLVYRNVSINKGEDIYGLYSKLRIGKNNDLPSVLDNGVKEKIMEKRFSKTDVIMTHGPNTWKVDFFMRIPANEGNVNEGIWEFDFGVRQRFSEFYNSEAHLPVFRAVVPIPGIWDGYNVTGEIIGKGDGITKIFNLRWFPIVDLSETIYIDNTPLIRNTDYTINTETSEVILDEAPPQDASITADYSIKHIPKDEDHVLDINFSIVFADGGSVWR